MRVVISHWYTYYGSLKINYSVKKFRGLTQERLEIPCAKDDNLNLIAFVNVLRDIYSKYKVKPKSLEVYVQSQDLAEGFTSGLIKDLMLNGWKDNSGELLADYELWTSALALYTSHVKSIGVITQSMLSKKESVS